MKKAKIFLMVNLMVVFTASVAYADAMYNAQRFLSDMSGKLVAMSTVVAGIAVATGAFMAKFSFGDEQKIKLGKKLIVNAIVLWAIVNGLTLILNTIAPYLN